jgi:alpha-acetolactate decarboxylase
MMNLHPYERTELAKRQDSKETLEALIRRYTEKDNESVWISCEANFKRFHVAVEFVSELELRNEVRNVSFPFRPAVDNGGKWRVTWAVSINE